MNEHIDDTGTDTGLDIAPLSPNEDREHSIINYLLSHPTVLIAIATGVVAALTFFIDYLSYLRSARVLLYWNIDTSFVSMNTSQLAYSAATAIFSLALSSIISMLITSAFSTYKSYDCTIVYYKRKYRTLKKRARKHIKAVKKFNNKHKDINQEANICDEFNTGKRETAKEFQKDFKELKQQIQETQKAFIGKLLINLIFPFFLSVICGVVVCFSNVNCYRTSPALLIVIFSFAIFLLDCVINIIINRVTMPKQKTAKEIESNLDAYMDELENTEFLYERIRKNGYKDCITNSAVVVGFLYVLLMLTIAFVVYSQPQNDLTKGKKGFEVVSVENEQYAAVFSNSEVIVLEKAIIEGNEIAIDLSKQRIVEVSDLSYEIKEFDKVTRLGLKESSKESSSVQETSEPLSEELTSAEGDSDSVSSDTTSSTSYANDLVLEALSGADKNNEE